MKEILVLIIHLLMFMVFPAVIWCGCHYNNWVVIIFGIFGCFCVKIDSHVGE